MSQEPEFAAAGSKLIGIIVEAVDELGNVDKNMDGMSYALKLDWNPSFCVPLNEGVCSLPAIDLPNACGIWTGIVELAQHQEIQTQILVRTNYSDSAMSLNLENFAMFVQVLSHNRGCELLVIYNELALQVEVKNSTRPGDDIPTHVEDSTAPVCDTPREFAGSATNVPLVKRHAQKINVRSTQEAILSLKAKVFLNVTLPSETTCFKVSKINSNCTTYTSVGLVSSFFFYLTGESIMRGIHSVIPNRVWVFEDVSVFNIVRVFIVCKNLHTWVRSSQIITGYTKILSP